jgi:uncharacterized caspase-like protein
MTLRGCRRAGAARLATLVVIVACAMAAHAVQENRLAVPIAGPERRLALVVGSDSYAEAPLRNARNDARAIARTLEGLGFRVTLLEDATRQALASAVSTFGDSLQANDVALFYFAGHGVQVDNDNFLLPIDFRGQSTTDVRFGSIRASEVQHLLQSARIAMMVLDACRNNPFARTRGASGLASMEARGSLIAFATGAGQTAADGTGGNGLFTQELVKVLGEPGLTAQDVFKRVQRSVYAASTGRQFPAVYDGLLGEFVFRPAAVASGTSASATQAADPQLAMRAELALWDAVKDAQIADPIEDYLRQYPAGRFKAAAEMRLAELRRAAAPPASEMPPGGRAATAENSTAVIDQLEAQLEKVNIQLSTGDQKERQKVRGYMRDPDSAYIVLTRACLDLLAGRRLKHRAHLDMIDKWYTLTVGGSEKYLSQEGTIRRRELETAFVKATNEMHGTTLDSFAEVLEATRRP